MVMAAASPSRAENYISAYGGVFLPGGGFSDQYEMGLDGGGSYIMVNEYTGLELGLHGYTLTAPDIDIDVTSVGGEVLVHFHKEEVTFQPFIAFGVGWYNTYFTSGSLEEKYSGTGTILRAGLRIFMSERFFVALSAKHFANRTDFPTGQVDLGGDSFNVEIGLVTF